MHSRIWRHRKRNPSLRPKRPGIWLPMGSQFQTRPRSLFLRPKSTQDSPLRPRRHWHARERPGATYSGCGPARACRGPGALGHGHAWSSLFRQRKLGLHRPTGLAWKRLGHRRVFTRSMQTHLEPEGAAGEGHLDPRPAGPPRGCPCPSARMFGPPLASNCRCFGSSS